MKPPPSAITALIEGTHADPFSLLGVLAGPGGSFVRAILPGAEVVVPKLPPGAEAEEAEEPVGALPFVPLVVVSVARAVP